MKWKKSQITMFIILGMVILMVFGVTYYGFNASRTSKIQSEGKAVIAETVQLTGLRSYVEQCVKQVAEDGLIKLGKQGGRLYEEQGGNMPVQAHIEIDSALVSYGVVRPEFTAGSAYPPPWQYPEPGPLANLGYLGLFGRSILPSLCDQFGENKPGTLLRQACPSYDTSEVTDITSVQEQLETHITNNLKKCVNFSAIPNVQNNIFEGEINTSVTIGKTDVEIAVTYPIEYRVAGGQPIIEFLEFRNNYEVRLIKIFQIIQDILNRDNFELLFNIKSEKTELKGYDPDIDVDLFERVCTNCNERTYDTLLQVRDKKSVVNNTAYIVQFLIDNRIPVLDWIGEFPNIDGYDIIVIEGDKIQFNVNGYDPDDLDRLTFNYSGWKEDYTEYFDYEAFEQNPVYPENYISVTNDRPRYWSNDDNYYEEFPNSSYQTLRSDAGPHNITISVHDQEGLKDWQDLKILVADIPVVKAQAKPIYPDIPANIASVEDIFRLDGKTFAAFTDVLQAYWEDKITGKRYDNLTASIPSDEIDIKNIKPEEFNSVRTHLFELTADSNYAGTIKQVLEIDVKSCVPHKSELTDKIYPYADVSDPYDTDHICCTDSYQLATGTVCYEENKFYCRPTRSEIGVASKALKDDGLVVVDADVSNANIMNIAQENLRDSENDVYERNYEQKCGNRGNVCSGTITDTWIVANDCKDWEGTEIARCQGPSSEKSKCDEMNPLNSEQCVDYTGTTFEKVFGLKDKNNNFASDICNPVFKCSRPLDEPTNGYGVADGYISCQATCGFGDCKMPILDSCICDSNCDSEPHCNGKKPGDLSGQCSSEKPYFEDICTGTCQYKDDTDPNKKFKCIEDGCNCVTDQCDGQREGFELGRCDYTDVSGLGENYYLDMCNDEAAAVDVNDICVYDSNKGCNALEVCNSFRAGDAVASCTNMPFFRDICTSCIELESDTTRYQTISLQGCTGPQECNGLLRNSISAGNGFCSDDGSTLTLYTGVMVDGNGDSLPGVTDAKACDATNLGLRCEEDWDGDFRGICKDSLLAGFCCTDRNDLWPPFDDC